MKFNSSVFWVAIVIIWFACVPCRIILSSTFEQKHLIEHATRTSQATLIALKPEFHDSVEFKYEVAGKTYSGLEFTHGDSQLKEIGRSVIFHFIPSDPQKGYLGDPPDLYSNIILLVVFGLAISVLLAWRLREKAEQDAAANL